MQPSVVTESSPFRAHPVLPSFVDIPTMTDGVDDDCPFVLQDLKNDSVRAFSDLVETFQVSLELKELCCVDMF